MINFRNKLWVYFSLILGFFNIIYFYNINSQLILIGNLIIILLGLIIIYYFQYFNNLKLFNLYIKFNILKKINLINLVTLSIFFIVFYQYCLIRKLFNLIFKFIFIIEKISLSIYIISDNLNYIFYIKILIILLFLILLFLMKKNLINIFNSILYYKIKLINWINNKIFNSKNKNKIFNIIKFFNKITIFKLSFIKSLLYFLNEDEDLIIKEVLDNSSLHSKSSKSETDSDIIENETEEHKELMKPIEFKNFKDITQKEQSNYIYQKMYNKAIEPNQFLIDWLVNSTLNNTNGNKSDIDDYINSNLNIIQKKERESQLMSHAFERTRPYPIKRIDPSPYAFPVYMPMKRPMDEWESQELIDAINKEKSKNEENNNSVSDFSNNETNKKS